jgi:signal transduction histidine kinase
MQGQLVALAEDVHALSRQLHPSILDDLGLVEALRSECASFTRREGIAVHYRPGEIATPLPRDIALCVYRVAQEALRNLAKHAAAREAWVTLAITPSPTRGEGGEGLHPSALVGEGLGVRGPELVLRVQDQGVGFDPAGLRSQPGLGLSSMEERVRLVGAELVVASAPGQGTTVEVRFPLERGDR